LLVVSSYTYVPHTISLTFLRGDEPKPDEIEYIPADWANRMVRSVNGGAELLRVRFKRPTHMTVFAQFEPRIALEKFGTGEDEPLLIGLSMLKDAVIEKIKLFEGQF